MLGFGTLLVISTGPDRLAFGADRKVRLLWPGKTKPAGAWTRLKGILRIKRAQQTPTITSKLFQVGERLGVASHGLLIVIHPEFYYSFPEWLEHNLRGCSDFTPRALAEHLQKQATDTLLPAMNLAQLRGYFADTKAAGETLLGIVVAGIDQRTKQNEIYQIRLDLREDGNGVEVIPLSEEFLGRGAMHCFFGFSDALGRAHDKGPFDKEIALHLQEARGRLRPLMQQADNWTLDLAASTVALIEYQSRRSPEHVGDGADVLVYGPSVSYAVNVMPLQNAGDSSLQKSDVAG